MVEISALFRFVTHKRGFALEFVHVPLGGPFPKKVFVVKAGVVFAIHRVRVSQLPRVVTEIASTVFDDRAKLNPSLA
jgi:hypothetical protein